MKERIRIGVSQDDEFDLDFLDGGVPNVDSVEIGRHYLCDGSITKEATSRGKNYVLLCRKCKLRVLVPQSLQTKEELIDFFSQQGFHQKGEELRICLNCEGRKWVRQKSLGEDDILLGDRPAKRLCEKTLTIECPECQGTGLLPKEAVA